MADFCCRFMDFRSLAANHNLHLFFPFSALTHSRNSRINYRIKRNPIRPTKNYSSDFDVISTHEHSDGSLLFRFGDPSEIIKNVKIEEQSKIVEEIEMEEEEDGKREANGVFDGDRRKEITGSGSTDVADQTNETIVNNIVVVESRELSSEISNGIEDELPVLSSIAKTEANEVFDGDRGKEITGSGSTDVADQTNESIVSNTVFVESRELLSEISNGIEDELPVLSSIAKTEANEVFDGDRRKEITGSEPADVSDQTNESIVNNTVVVESRELLSEISNGIEDELPVLSSVAKTEANEVFDGDRRKEITGSEPADVADQTNESIVNNTVVVESRELLSDISNGIEEELPVLSSIAKTEVSGKVDTSSILDKSFAETEYDVITTSENHEIVQDDENNVTTTLGLHETENEIVEDVRECCDADVGTMDPRTEETRISLFEGTKDGTDSLNVLNTDENMQSGEILEALVRDELTESKSATMSQELLMTNFVLTSGAALLSHPSKALTGGEDAYFVAGQTWFGVADGVGRWSLEGSNPGVYAQELIKICEKLVSDCNGISVNNAVELLKLSVAETHSPGSSTVLIAQFDGQALNVANIGDSGFIIFRNGVVYKRSSPMHHAFHFPLRIERGDHPSMLAKLYRVDLKEDDVIITATDGLLDNLYDQEISTIVMKSLDANKRLEKIAEFLATRAQEIGRSGSTRSPFADEAQTAGFANYNGGKLDDVAVIVSLVQRQSNTENL